MTVKQGRNQGGICKCEGCAERFSGMTAFDMHRVGDYAVGRRKRATRHCLNIAEMSAKGMRVGNRNAWTTGAEFASGLWTAAGATA